MYCVLFTIHAWRCDSKMAAFIVNVNVRFTAWLDHPCVSNHWMKASFILPPELDKLD